MPLPPGSSKAKHIISILKLGVGDKLKVGLLNGGIGEALIKDVSREGQIDLIFPSSQELNSAPVRFPIHLVLGHPRIPVIQRLVKDFSSLGVSRISVLGTELSEKSYWNSRFWEREEWINHIWEGAEQGGYVSLPSVEKFWSLRDFLEKVPHTDLSCYFHLNPDLPFGLPYLLEHVKDHSGDGVAFALGPERGWTNREIDLLNSHNWQGLFLGPGVWRTESVGQFTAGLANHLFSWMASL